MTRIAVIALQGDVSEHVSAAKMASDSSDVKVIEVRRPGIIPKCDGIILPGGESTTIGLNLYRLKMDEEIKNAVSNGVPMLATCAGLVLVSSEIEGDSRVKPMGLMDITVGRNVFGSQKESFEADLAVKGFDRPYRAVFIRAPAITRCGPSVDPLAYVGENVVAARQDQILALAFHPELTSDMRFNHLFMNMVLGK